MTREEMMNDIASKFGLEASLTIWFFQMCELEDNETNRRIIEIAYDALASFKFDDEEEGE